MNDRTNKSSPDGKTRGNESKPPECRGRREKISSKVKATKLPDTAIHSAINTNAPSFSSAAAPPSRIPPTSSSKPAPPAASARAPPLCRFFVLQGHCRYGDECNFSHTLPQGGVVEARKQIPCRFFLQGNCRYGDRCELRHDNPDGADKEEALTCGICLEPVGNEYNKRFGLLEGCDHVYCMECVMTWRSEGSSEAQDRRVCPSCRTKSFYVIPSWEYCVGEEKKQVMTKYKAKLAKLPCKRFDGTFGSCPFGRDCFYAHMRHDKNVKSQDKSMEEIHRNRDERRRRARLIDDLEVINSFLMLLELTRDFDEWDTDSDDERDLDWWER